MMEEELDTDRITVMQQREIRTEGKLQKTTEQGREKISEGEVEKKEKRRSGKILKSKE